MAQKKGGGSTRNGRDSQPKMLGVKVFGGQSIPAGSIIVRQRTSCLGNAPTRNPGQGRGFGVGLKRAQTGVTETTCRFSSPLTAKLT